MSEYLGKGARLSTGPSESLAVSAFAYELRATPFLFEYLGYADMAHTAALLHGGIIDADVGRRLLDGLVRLQSTAYDTLQFDPFVGDIYNNRDGFLKQALGPEADRIHIGRARREAVTTAWQLACRRRMVRLGRAITELCDVMAGQIEEHRATVMPDFTYLQHAHPTTLGHYLLGFLYPLLRDEERIALATARLNRSPAGSGSVNGSRFPIDRGYIASLLAFEGLMTHNRDAMWAPDMTIEAMTSLVTTMTNLDRLAEDLFLWATEEFSLIDLNDAHCRTSVIMPQKKNPYGLAHIRGHARNMVGTFTGLVCNGLTASGQPDNRVFAYHDLPEAIDDTRHCVELMRDSLAGSRFDKERMGQSARQGYAYATDLCDFLVVETGIDNRSAHRLIGLAVSRRTAQNAEITAQDAREAAATLGIDLPAFDAVAFEKNREPEVLIGLRRGVGGAADEPMTAMLTEARTHIDRARQAWHNHSDIDFESRLIERIGDLAGDPSCPTTA